MKSEVKTKWLEALRSGKYRKGMFQLKTTSPKGGRAKFCCLGVLCDLYLKETGDGKWFKDHFWVGNDYVYTVLPEKVRRWAGLNRLNPKLRVEDNVYHEIAEVNDGEVFLRGSNKVASFKQIADAIEHQIPG